MCFSPAEVWISQNRERERDWDTPPGSAPPWLYIPRRLLWQDGGCQGLRWWSFSFHSSLKEFVLLRDHCKDRIESTNLRWKRYSDQVKRTPRSESAQTVTMVEINTFDGSHPDGRDETRVLGRPNMCNLIRLGGHSHNFPPILLSRRRQRRRLMH